MKMKKLIRTCFFFLAFAALLPLGGCDLFRSLAGRPTAEELELGQITNLINLAPSESGEFSAKIKVPQTAQDGVWKIKMVVQ